MLGTTVIVGIRIGVAALLGCGSAGLWLCGHCGRLIVTGRGYS